MSTTGCRLPTRHRIASAVAAVVLMGSGWLVLAGGSVVGPGPIPDEVLTGGVWVLVGLLALNTVGNLAARHPLERWGAGGLTAVLTVLCAVVALCR